jgi:protease I
MDQALAGKTVAILVANGFEETEMTEPQRALLKAGAALRTISPEQGLVNGWHGTAWGHYFPVDRSVGDVLGADFDMLLLPGGERSIAKLAQNAHTRRIVGHFLDAGKPVAAIDQGVQLLVTPGKLKNRRIAIDAETVGLAESGAVVAEETLVVDGALVTARGLDDLPAFVQQVVKAFAEAVAVRKAA